MRPAAVVPQKMFSFRPCLIVPPLSLPYVAQITPPVTATCSLAFERATSTPPAPGTLSPAISLATATPPAPTTPSTAQMRASTTFHGNNDIYIGNLGPNSGSESSTIRIGGGYDPQTATYISGIYGSTSPSGIPVYINSNGQLRTQPSSLRFKEQVRDMGDSTSGLMKLRPVTFLYKPEYDKGERTLQYGLIVEAVAKVYPELVAYDNDGQPYSVRYQYLITMLLHEAQKQYHRAEAEAKVITAQEQKIDELEQRLSRLERLIGNQVQTVAQK